jgi:hypothetical protein
VPLFNLVYLVEYVKFNVIISPVAQTTGNPSLAPWPFQFKVTVFELGFKLAFNV